MDISVIFALLLPLILDCIDNDDDEGVVKSIKNPNRRQKLILRWTLRRGGATRSEIKEVFAALEDLTDEEARELVAAAKDN